MAIVVYLQFSESLHGPCIESPHGLLQLISTSLNLYLDPSLNLHQYCFSESQPYFFNESLSGPSLNLDLHFFSESQPSFFNESLPGPSIESSPRLLHILYHTTLANIYPDCFSEYLPGISPWNNYQNPSLNLHLHCFSESLPELLQ